MRLCIVLMFVIFQAVFAFGEIVYTPIQDSQNLNETFTKENLEKAKKYCETISVRFNSAQEIDNRLLSRMQDNVNAFANLKTVSNSTKKYYLHTMFKSNWFLALHHCLSRSLRLVSISSKAENDQIITLIDEAGLKTESFWTSGTNFGNRGIFYWIGNGRPVTYNDWQPGEPGEPGDLTGNDDCVELSDYNGNVKWNDAPWYQQKYFICEQLV